MTERERNADSAMARFIDPLCRNNFIDSNILDEVADGQVEAVQEIIRASDDGEITVLLPYSVCNEIKRPNTPAQVKKIVSHFVFSVEVNLTENEKSSYRDLLGAVKGDAQEKNIAPDLFHVWEAAKNGGGCFITRDKRLLARAPAIADRLQIEVMTPARFLELLAEARQRKAEHEKRQ